MPVPNSRKVVSSNIVKCLIVIVLVKPKEPQISGNYTARDKHVLELNSAGLTKSRMYDNGKERLCLYASTQSKHGSKY
jgi:hypothetical protein